MAKHEELIGLFGNWIHVHEQDRDDLRVFIRAGSQPLPPSRGRLRLVLGRGGQLQVEIPGPDDRIQALDGTWSLDLDRQQLRLDYAQPEYGVERYWIESLIEDTLILRQIFSTPEAA